jgi:DNA-binding transcriptional regulator/RsmH inhibitor MraZ
MKYEECNELPWDKRYMGTYISKIDTKGRITIPKDLREIILSRQAYSESDCSNLYYITIPESNKIYLQEQLYESNSSNTENIYKTNLDKQNRINISTENKTLFSDNIEDNSSIEVIIKGLYDVISIEKK